MVIFLKKSLSNWFPWHRTENYFGLWHPIINTTTIQFTWMCVWCKELEVKSLSPTLVFWVQPWILKWDFIPNLRIWINQSSIKEMNNFQGEKYWSQISLTMRPRKGEKSYKKHTYHYHHPPFPISLSPLSLSLLFPSPTPPPLPLLPPPITTATATTWHYHCDHRYCIFFSFSFFFPFSSSQPKRSCEMITTKTISFTVEKGTQWTCWSTSQLHKLATKQLSILTRSDLRYILLKIDNSPPPHLLLLLSKINNTVSKELTSLIFSIPEDHSKQEALSSAIKTQARPQNLRLKELPTNINEQRIYLLIHRVTIQSAWIFLVDSFNPTLWFWVSIPIGNKQAKKEKKGNGKGQWSPMI